MTSNGDDVWMSSIFEKWGDNASLVVYIGGGGVSNDAKNLPRKDLRES